MRRLLLLLLALVIVSNSGLAQDKTWAPIQITWHGQSFFAIKTSKGNIIAIDPHLIQEYGRPEGVKADVILMSHQHTDHTQLGAIENSKDKNVKIIPGLSGFGNRATWNHVDEQVKDSRIRTVASYHDDMEGLKYGRNTIFIIEVDGWRICHLGDLGHELTPAQLKKIGPVDVLMIPVGGIYTLNGAEAKKVVAQIQPREYIFPMHRGTKIYDLLLPADEFLEDQPRANVAHADDNKITLNRDPQRPRPLIVMLHHWPKGRK